MLKTKHKAKIGVIGGSGFYSLLKGAQAVKVNTPYGAASSSYMLGKVGSKTVAFLPRHGEKHTFPPHKINYKANIYGFKELGVKYIISPCAAGSLQPNVKPGSFVIADQFVDKTNGRKDSYYDGPKTVHVAMDEPYCPHLRKLAIKIGETLKYSLHKKGTVVVINGPRFSSKSESQSYSSHGWEVINMTQYPEVALARELEMCFVNISLITDFDVGVREDDSVKAVTADAVVKIFNKNNKKVKKMILEMIKSININRKCSCHSALQHAVM